MISKKPIIIAELSGNHNKSIKNAMLLVKKAALAKADFIKLQTYTPDTMTINSNKKDFPVMLKKVGSWIGTAKKYINNIQNEVSNIEIEENQIKKEEEKKDDS